MTSAVGFKAEGVHAGFREDPERLDMALVLADDPVPAAAVFTRNVFCAAPVQVSRSHLGATGSGASAMDAGAPAWGVARAVAINSGIANAATGSIGFDAARQTAGVVADAVGCTAEEVLVASTGVIGVHLPLAPFEKGIPQAVASASADPSAGGRAARAIMTTDTRPKRMRRLLFGRRRRISGLHVHGGRHVEGRGHDHAEHGDHDRRHNHRCPDKTPRFACCPQQGREYEFQQDHGRFGHFYQRHLHLLRVGCGGSRGSACFDPETPAFDAFERALTQVCTALARAMASDGGGGDAFDHGARVGRCRREGRRYRRPRHRELSAREDRGVRQGCELGPHRRRGGSFGAKFSQHNVDIDIMGMPVCRGGLAVDFDEGRALELFENPEVDIAVDLGEGDGETCIWTCDFSHEYVTINGDYRS